VASAGAQAELERAWRGAVDYRSKNHSVISLQNLTSSGVYFDNYNFSKIKTKLFWGIAFHA
jgi:hypothetical protein